MRAPVVRLNHEFILRSTAIGLHPLSHVCTHMYLRRDGVNNSLVFWYLASLVVCQGNESPQHPFYKNTHEPWTMVPMALASTLNAFHVCFCNGLYPDWSARDMFWLSQQHLPFIVFCPWARHSHPWKHWKDTQNKGQFLLGGMLV